MERESCGVWEAQCISEVCNTSPKVTIRHLCVDERTYCSTYCLDKGDKVVLRVLCVIRTLLWSCWWFHWALLVVLLFASRASSHCKYNMGALSWLFMKTLKTASTPPYWQTCKVLCPWVLFCETTIYMYLSHNHPTIRTVRLVSFPDLHFLLIGVFTTTCFCVLLQNSGKPGN